MSGLFRGHLKDARDLLRKAPRLAPLLGAGIVGNINAGMLLLVVPLFLLDRGFSFFQLGVVFSLTTVASVGVQLLAGRYPGFFARPAVVVGLLALSVIAFPFFVLIQTPVQFLAVTSLAQLSSAAATPGIQLIFARLAPSEDLGKAFGILGGASSIAYASAVVLGGLLAAGGYVRVFYVGSVLAVIAFILVARSLLDARAAPALRDPMLARHARALAVWQTDLERVRVKLQSRLPARHADRNVWFAAAYTFLFSVSLAVYPVYFPRYLVAHGLALPWVGLVIAASWFSFGLAQPIGARLAQRTGRPHEVVFLSLAAAALLNLALAFAPLPLLILAWVLLGIADGVGRPVSSALIVASLPPHRHAKAFGWTSAADSIAQIVAPVTFAIVIVAAGTSAGLALVAFVLLLAAVPLIAIRLPRDNVVVAAARPVEAVAA